MLQLSGGFSNTAVMGLRTGAVVAHVIHPIINPNNLKIEGFYCQDHFSREQLVLLTQDIRDQIPQGFIVNDHDVLSDPADLIRLQDIIKINFELVGKHVISDKKRRLGKVNDYAVDSESMYVQKLYVGQSLLKSISGGQLSIDRDQIVEINNRQIVIHDPLQGKRSEVRAAVPAS